jgi:hypothetical protein
MYGRQWRRRRTSDDGGRAGLAIVMVLVGGLIGGTVVGMRLADGASLAAPRMDVLTLLNGPRPERVQSGFPAAAQRSAEPAAEVTGATVAAQPAVAPTAQPTQQPEQDRATVAHTDGVGVVLRASPRDSDWTPRGFMDGARVTILERKGTDWAYIRGENGQEGWVPARYLVP